MNTANLLTRHPCLWRISRNRGIAAAIVQCYPLQRGTLEHFNIPAVFLSDRQDRIGEP